MRRIEKCIKGGDRGGEMMGREGVCEELGLRRERECWSGITEYTW